VSSTTAVTAMSSTATTPATASTAPIVRASTPAAATTAAAPTISASIAPRSACFAAWFVTIEIRLTFGFFGEVAATFDGHRRSAAFGRSLTATHFRALLFQNRLARKPDAVALDRKYLH
jgi:hypothetical protein